MSHQCSCGRDLNNNYVSYTSAYANGNSNNNNNSSSNSSHTHHHHLDRETNGTLNAKNCNKIGSTSATTTAAKLIVGPVGMGVGMSMGVGVGVGVGMTSLKDLRDKDINRSVMARAGDRRN